MYKLYTVTKKKTGILELWKDESGKIFRDKIKIEACENSQVLNEKCALLFESGEKAVFYTMLEDYAFIQDKNYDKPLEFLRHRITWHEKKLKTSFLKILLIQHNGITIYKNKNNYTIELWKA